MPRATLACLVVLVGCSDVRDFRGTWRGPSVGSAAVLRVNISPGASATLAISQIDTYGMQGTLTVDGLVQDAPLTSLDSAEADVLSTMSWSGSPLHNYVGFVTIPDGKGDALALVALYDDHRVEVRVLRGGPSPLYGIFALEAS